MKQNGAKLETFVGLTPGLKTLCVGKDMFTNDEFTAFVRTEWLYKIFQLKNQINSPDLFPHLRPAVGAVDGGHKLPQKSVQLRALDVSVSCKKVS